MSEDLLTLGVEQILLIHDRLFNMGGIGVWTHDRPFSIVAPALVWSHERPFNIGSAFSWQHDRPFSVGEVLTWSHDRPFSIIEQSTTGGGSGSPTTGGTSTASPAAATALAAPASVLSRQITVAATAGISIGSAVVIGADTRLVTAIAGPVLTLDAAPSRAWASGTGVIAYAGTVLTAPAAVGATTLTVASASGIAAGTQIAVTGSGAQFRTVTAVSGGTLTLSAALGGAVGAGSLVSVVPASFTGAAVSNVPAAGGSQWVRGRLLIFDKAGHSLGSVTEYTTTETRSMGIRVAGNLAVSVPASHPDAALMLDDCLVAIVSNVGLPTWGGEIGRHTTNGGAVEVNIPDVTNLLTGFKLTFTEDERTNVDGLAASAVYDMVLTKYNAIRQAHGEVPFTGDLSTSNAFRGDLDEDGEAADFIELIARRSQTEWATACDVSSGSFVPILRARDKFTGGSGVAFIDGPGGNIEDGSIQYISDPSTAIRKLKLTGLPTDVVKYVHDFAQWAVHEVTPTVEIVLPDPSPDTPGTPRFREDVEVTVDWGLAKAEQQRLAQLTEDQLWVMFYSYLYAWHDIWGMPYHPSWAYEGPPADIEPQLTLDKWHTHQELVLYHTTTPGHIVMANEADKEWLIVVYYISQESKLVRIESMTQAIKYGLPTATLPAGTSVTLYEVINKKARPVATYTWLSTDSWLLFSPVVVTLADGTPITLRGIVTSPFSGRYVNIAEVPWQLAYQPATTDINTSTEMITRVWPYERLRVNQWDPRRDGTGEFLSRESIWNGHLTTAPRWHIVPYSVGDASTTQLAQGIYHYDSVIYVEAVDGWPTTYPFTILVGDPLGQQEPMTVLSSFGGQLLVRRGTSIATTTTGTASAGSDTVTVSTPPDATIVTGFVVILGGTAYTVAEVNGSSIRLTTPLTSTVGSGSTAQFTTAAMTFETGAPVSVVGAAPFEGFVFPYSWPEGEVYAQEWIDRHRAGSRVISFRVIDRNGTWASAGEYGSQHATTIATEGIINVTGRIIAISPGEEPGTMEVVQELDP